MCDQTYRDMSAQLLLNNVLTYHIIHRQQHSDERECLCVCTRLCRVISTYQHTQSNAARWLCSQCASQCASSVAARRTKSNNQV